MLLIALAGIFIIILFCCFLSRSRRRIGWRTPLIGLLIQGGLCYFVLNTTIGGEIFWIMGEAINNVVKMADRGGEFVFGGLYSSEGFVFAFKVSAAIIFVSSLVSALYYMKILQPIVRLLSIVVQRLLGVSGAEVLASVASALVGQVESALPLRPYFGKLTGPQFFAILTGGMATMSAAMVATYAGMGLPAQYLVAANILGIPGGLITAKIIMPPTGREEIKLPNPELPQSANLVDAIVHGAQEGLKISLAVVSMAIALIALIALIDGSLSMFQLSIAKIFGWAFAPLAYLLGVPPTETAYVGSLIGIKLALNEFVAYSTLLERTALCPISRKAYMVSIFAICGFANLGSIAIQLGAFAHMVPERRAELAKMGLLAMIAGALSSCLSACWVSLFTTN